MRAAASLAGALLLAGSAVAAGQPAERLEPYQLARSLQIVQDRIADGDHAAMPMQRKLIEMLDLGLRGASAHDLAQRRNFSALLVYGMSGGNPSTFDAAAARLDLRDTELTLAKGIALFLAGDVAGADRNLLGVDHRIFEPPLGSLLALVKGSVAPPEEAERALAMFDQARLLAPGTLVEEAALRRSLPLAVAKGDARRFLALSSAYVRRFLRSPYASQFAQGFVDGVASMFASTGGEAVAEIMAWMNNEQARALYLRLARRAAVDGDEALLSFASAGAELLLEAGADPRSVLYSGIASVTSDAVEDVLNELSKLDRARLSAADKALLDAAQRVADAVITPPDADALEAVADAEQPLELVTSARARLEAIDALLQDAPQ